MQNDALNVPLEESTRQKYQEILDDVGQIPTLPNIVMRAMNIINDPNASADDLGQLLSRDPALSFKVLRLANSAFYGIPRSISSISQAVTILGFNTLRSLVLSATVFKLFDSHHTSVDISRYWKHSFVAAAAARLLARHVSRYQSVDGESAFMAALLHKIGVLLFDLVAPETHTQILVHLQKDGATLAELEAGTFGINYAQFGGLLAERWELPEELQRPIALHLSPVSDPNWAVPASLVHVAAVLTERSNLSLTENGSAFPLRPEALTSLNLTEEMLTALQEELAPEISNANSFFEIMQG